MELIFRPNLRPKWKVTEHKAIMANNVLSVPRHVIDIDGGACRFCGCFLAASATECFCQLKFCQIGNKASIDYWFVVRLFLATLPPNDNLFVFVSFHTKYFAFHERIFSSNLWCSLWILYECWAPTRYSSKVFFLLSCAKGTLLFLFFAVAKTKREKRRTKSVCAEQGTFWDEFLRLCCSWLRNVNDLKLSVFQIN